MRGIHIAIATLFLTSVSQAHAQTAAPFPRADLGGSIGWLNVNKNELDNSDEWYNRSLYGGASGGWYWTEHLKTEIEVGASTTADLYTFEQIVVDGRQTYVSSEARFSTKRVAVSQQYQFFRNAWFHPHIAAGVDLTWERSTRDFQPVIGFNDQTRQTRVVLPERTIGPETDLIVRPFVTAGFKAYMSPRAFFRGDTRLAIRSGIDEVLFRAGFGVDF
jgi:hypothetical protein